MEKDACVEPKNGEAAVDQPKPAATAPYRYTKEELLEIKQLPISNERPECLSEKYDSDGVWDPEKWHASLYPTSERSSPVEGFKKDYMDDRVPLKRRIPVMYKTKQNKAGPYKDRLDEKAKKRPYRVD